MADVRCRNVDTGKVQFFSEALTRTSEFRKAGWKKEPVEAEIPKSATDPELLTDEPKVIRKREQEPLVEKIYSDKPIGTTRKKLKLNG